MTRHRIHSLALVLLFITLLVSACSQTPAPTPPTPPTQPTPPTPPTPPTQPVTRLRVRSADLKEAYQRGEAGVATFRLQLEDSENSVTDAVAFLNLVLVDEDGRIIQMMHRIFEEDAYETPPLFQQPLRGEQLREGLETTLHFRIRPDAPPGSYRLVMQLFSGLNTNPNAVNPDERLGVRNFTLRIEP